MNLDELQQAWKSQDTRTTVHAVLLLESMRKKQRRHQRSIWLRNLREGWLTILAAVYFTVFTESDVESKLQLWPFYIAMAILFGIGVFRVIDNHRQQRRTLQYRDSTLSFIECSILDINHRVWLLENIAWWWILPVAFGGLLIVAQVLLLAGLQDPAVHWMLARGVGIGCVILGIIYWGNRWTARKYWLPRKVELEAIANSLRTN